MFLINMLYIYNYKAKWRKYMGWFKKHKIITAILVIVGLGIVVSAAGGGSDTNTSQNSGNGNTPQSAKEDTAATAKLNEAARDGKFEFVVKSVECGKSEVVSPESDALRQKAQGQYCLMTVTVKNIGNEQQFFSASDQKLLNASNQQYTADSTATLYNGGSNQQLLAQINPGNSVEGVLVFDIPADQTAVTAELHDSAFSDGVKVSLQ